VVVNRFIFIIGIGALSPFYFLKLFEHDKGASPVHAGSSIPDVPAPPAALASRCFSPLARLAGRAVDVV